MENHFHTRIGILTESLWDVLEETLQSAWLLLCQYKILNKNVRNMYFHQEVHRFLLLIHVWKCLLTLSSWNIAMMCLPTLF